jgi:hypothetical protein
MELSRQIRIAFRVADLQAAPSQAPKQHADYLQDVSALQRDLTKILAKLQKAVQAKNKDLHRKVMDEYAARIEEHQAKWPGDDWGYESI